MKQKRMRQLIWMFSDITGVPPGDARQIILLTETGKAVMDDDPAVLFEQQTENIYEIALELEQMPSYAALSSLFSTEKIVSAMKRLQDADLPENAVVAPTASGKPYTKSGRKEWLLSRRNALIKIRKQNQLNAWRITYADSFKRLC